MLKQRRLAYKPRLECLEDRCTPSAGMLDPTFNPTGSPPGTASAPVAVLGSFNYAQSYWDNVLVQPSGKVVMTGWCGTANSGGQISNGQFYAVSFNADGSLDLTFGSGGAAVTTTQKKGEASGCYAATLYPTGGPGDQKILEVGWGYSPGGFAVSLVRFNANGSLDTSFGSGGYVFTTPNTLDNVSMDVILQANGTALPKIVVAAESSTVLYLFRYNPDGSIDKSFGSSSTGMVSYHPYNASSRLGYHLAHGGAAGADLIVAGGSYLMAFTPNGALDTNFGGTGVVSTSKNIPRLAHAAYQADGKIVVAGNRANVLVKGHWIPVGPSLARYNANGTLDTSFGSGGVVSTAVATPGAPALALQADGKIVLGDGSSLFRYNSDGSLDATFGTGGSAAGPLSASLAIAPNGDIVAGLSLSVARYLPSAPQIGSVTASQSGAGAPVMLTASNLTDANPNSTITQVTFYYYDALGNKVVLGTVTAPDGSGNWDLTFSLPPGNYTLYALAEDSYGVFGNPFALNLSVQ